MMGLGTGAVSGAVIGTVAGLDMTKMVATIAVCGVVLCIMCAVLRKFGIFVMTFFGSWGDICYPCGSAVSYSTWNLRSGCTGHRNTDSHLCGIPGHLCNRYCRRSGSRNGTSVSSWDDKDWLDRICNECSDRSNWHHGSDNDAVEKDRKEGKIFSKKIKEQVSMESEVEKARMLLDDGDVEESPEEETEAGNQGDQGDQGEPEETVTEIFDIDDDKPEPEDTDDEENVDAKMTDVPEGGFLDEDDVEIFETDDSDVVVLHADDID